MFADKIKWNKVSRSPCCEEHLRYKFITLKTKMILQIKETIENRPRLGQGRARMKCRKPQLTENITTIMNISYEILKIPTTQNVSKNRMDFPVQEQ